MSNVADFTPSVTGYDFYHEVQDCLTTYIIRNMGINELDAVTYREGLTAEQRHNLTVSALHETFLYNSNLFYLLRNHPRVEEFIEQNVGVNALLTEMDINSFILGNGTQSHLILILCTVKGEMSHFVETNRRMDITIHLELNVTLDNDIIFDTISIRRDMDREILLNIPDEEEEDNFFEDFDDSSTEQAIDEANPDESFEDTDKGLLF